MNRSGRRTNSLSHSSRAWLLFGITSPFFVFKTLFQSRLHERGLLLISTPLDDLILLETLSLEKTRQSLFNEKASHLLTIQESDPRQQQLRSQLSRLVKEDDLDLPPHTPGAFLHIGKCGGSTLSQQLRNGCHSFVAKPCRNITQESYISKLTTYIHTPDFRRLGHGNYTFDFFVATLRDPLKRFVSAFVFMHPKNKLESEQRFYRRLQVIYDCFPTVEEFAQKLGDFHLREIARSGDNCTLLARDIVQRKVRFAYHFYFDNRFLVEKLPTETPMIAVRNEHLWDDWKTANQWLGQEEVAVFPDDTVRDYSNHTLAVTKSLSEIGRQRLCKGLEREYQAWWQLIDRAVNLSPEEKKASLEMARESCPDIRIVTKDL